MSVQPSAVQVLVVDDIETNAKLLRVVLEEEGYVVATAASAAEALALLETYTPRLILMDVQLPGMSGLDLTRQLRADPRHAGVIIVAVTASAMPEDEARARAAGCDDYVTKPIDLERFLATVARHAPL